MIVVLADSHLAYRGTLGDMCEFFAVAPRNSRTNLAIREAIQKLERNGLIKSIQDGRMWTLTLSRNAERKSKVISIKREWVNIANNYNNKRNPVEWIQILKVWLYLCDNKKEIIKTSEIAESLNTSPSTVSRAKKALEQDIGAIVCQTRGEVWDGRFYCLGQAITVAAWIDE